MRNVIGPNTKLGKVERVGKYHWVVYSMDPKRLEEGANYHVAFNPSIKKFTCGCPEYLFRHNDFTPCKHVKKVAETLRKEAK